MKSPPERPRLRKREILFAVAAGVLAAGGAAAILSDDIGPGPQREVREAGSRTYQLAGFERVATTGPQDVEITFGETFAVSAEGSVGRLDVAVENGELVIRPRTGDGWDWDDFEDTRILVTMPKLTRVSLTGSGDVDIDAVRGDRFEGIIDGGFGGTLAIGALEVEEAEFTINGLGEIAAAGTARATRATINGLGEVDAGALRSQTAVVALRGAGDVELTVDQEADVTVEGPGDVDISGPARCSIKTAGPGSVSCGEQTRD